METRGKNKESITTVPIITKQYVLPSLIFPSTCRGKKDCAYIALNPRPGQNASQWGSVSCSQTPGFKPPTLHFYRYPTLLFEDSQPAGLNHGGSRTYKVAQMFPGKVGYAIPLACSGSTGKHLGGFLIQSHHQTLTLIMNESAKPQITLELSFVLENVFLTLAPG